MSGAVAQTPRPIISPGIIHDIRELARPADRRRLDASPAAGAVSEAADSNQLEIRFDRMLDPRHSSLSIMRDGQAIETLHPSLDASPGILFARGPRLAPGDYKLHWSVKSLNGTEVAEGDIAFSVKS